MKKIFIFLCLIFISPQTYAFEDYIMLSENPVLYIKSEDEDIICPQPFFTIDNNKNITILKAKKEGKTFLRITTSKTQNIIEVEVQPEKTVVQETDGYSFFVLDMPENADGTNFN